MDDTWPYGVLVRAKSPRTFATFIRAARKRRGLTQEQLAEQSDVGRSTIIRWENGQTEPSREQLHAVAAVLDVPVEDVYEALGWLPPSAAEPRSREQIMAELFNLFPDEADRSTLRDVLELLELRHRRREGSDENPGQEAGYKA